MERIDTERTIEIVHFGYSNCHCWESGLLTANISSRLGFSGHHPSKALQKLPAHNEKNEPNKNVKWPKHV
jgi:hypothetical protein